MNEINFIFINEMQHEQSDKNAEIINASQFTPIICDKPQWAATNNVCKPVEGQGCERVEEVMRRKGGNPQHGGRRNSFYLKR